MRIQSNLDYNCENGAWHSSPCCMTCWNLHPNNFEGDCFIHDHRSVKDEILRIEWMKQAVSMGFTTNQAAFLYQTVYQGKLWGNHERNN